MRWKWVVSFTPLLLFPRGKSLGTQRIGDWVDPRAGLDDMEKWKFLTLLGLKLRPLGHPVCGQSLYRLHYCTSKISYKCEYMNISIQLYFLIQCNTICCSYYSWMQPCVMWCYKLDLKLHTKGPHTIFLIVIIISTVHISCIGVLNSKT
jgi:hypothetical protein